MGQRHQIFIKVNNPIKLKRNYVSKEENSKARKIFGNGKHTILAIHHQWLYGRSAVYNIGHIFDITKNMNDYNNPFSDDYLVDSLDSYINDVMMLLQVQTNPLHPRGTGIEKMTFLNTECLDENGNYEDKWGDIRLDFRNGDNNDGIKELLINIIKQNNKTFEYDLGEDYYDYWSWENWPDERFQNYISLMSQRFYV